MKNMRSDYVALCEQLNFEPEQRVEKALKNSEVSGCLSFQGDTTLSASTCQILGKLISYSQELLKLDFANCMIPASGLGDLMNGLKKNKSVKELDLSSNNLQAASAVHIGTYLRYSKTLVRLFLQWNSLGQSKEAFGVFCEGVGSNQSLQELDLRNNSLGESSAEDIAFAIKANKSLKTIDLRWNQLGPNEGKCLLNAVQDSSQLACIQLEGNLFNCDLIMAIEMAAAHNADIMQLAQEWEARCSLLTKHSIELEKRDEKRSTGLRQVLQQQGHKINNLNKEQMNELIRVEEQLKSKKKRMETMESLISNREQQIETLREMNKSLQEEKDMTQKESTELGEQLGLVREQISSAQKVINQYKLQQQAMEHEIKSLQQENSNLKGDMMLHSSKCGDVIKAAEERALAAIHKARSEKSHAEEAIKSAQKKYDEKLNDLEVSRVNLEKQRLADKETHQHALENLQQKLAMHDAEHLQARKQEQDEFKSSLDASKLKVNSLRKELQERKDEIAKLSFAETELKQAVVVEKEKNATLQEKLNDSARRKEEADGLKEQITRVQMELVALREEKDSQIKQLTNLLTSQEKHLSELRFDEAERTGILCSAVTKYISKVGSKVSTSDANK